MLYCHPRLFAAICSHVFHKLVLNIVCVTRYGGRGQDWPLRNVTKHCSVYTKLPGIVPHCYETILKAVISSLLILCCLFAICTMSSAENMDLTAAGAVSEVSNEPCSSFGAAFVYLVQQ